MPAIIDAITQQNDMLPEIDVRTSIVLFKFGSKERAKPTARAKALGATEGNLYLKGTFIGEDEKGNLTCQKVLNVYFAKTEDAVFFLGDEEEDIEGVGSSCFVFLQGTLGWNDIEVDSKLNGNKSYSLSATSLCKYNSQGEFTYSELHADGKLESLTLKGTPGAVVTLVASAKSRVMELAPKLDPNTRPARKAIKVSSKPMSLEPDSEPSDQDFDIPSQEAKGKEAVSASA
jgi:hypothetical protein